MLLPLLQVSSSHVDWSKTFLHKKVSLQVSSQLPLEAMAKGFHGVWTDNASFRADPSMTRRHLCEFKHIEAESRYFDTLEQLMNFEEDLVKFVIVEVLSQCIDEYELLERSQTGLSDRLLKYSKCDFVRVTYTEVITILHDQVVQVKEFARDVGSQGDFSIPMWSDDLGSICERYLTEVVYKQPVFITNFPRSLKSFYMKTDKAIPVGSGCSDDLKTMQGCDLLIPYLGELIGGSVRESDYDSLMAEISRRQMDITPVQWYVDLRKNGSVPTGGFGLGFGRLVAVLCSLLPEIQDVTPFPVSYGSIYY